MFSIGEFIGCFTILIAIFQLLNPVKSLKIQMGSLSLKKMYFLSGLSAFCVFYASTLEFFYPKSSFFLCMPWFWQFSAGIILTVSIGVILWEISTPIKVNKRNIEIFFTKCHNIIACGKHEYLIELASEVEPSLSTIFDFAMGKEPGKREFMWAFSLLTLFSDKLFCKLCVIHNPKTVCSSIRIVSHGIEKKGVVEKFPFVQEILIQLFKQKKSIFYRELPNSGLGWFVGVRALICRNASFLRSSYRPLNIPNYFLKSGMTSWQIEQYFEVFEEALEHVFLNAKDKRVESSVFFVGLHCIAGLVGTSKYNIQGISQSSSYALEAEKVLHGVYNGVHSILYSVLNFKDKIPNDECSGEIPLDVVKTEDSIYAALAKGICDILVTFSSVDRTYFLFRQIMLELFVLNLSKQPVINSISRRLDVLIRDRIWDEQNGEFLSPALIAALISTFGLREPLKQSSSLRKFVIEKLKKEFLKAFYRNDELALIMLPKDTEYDSENKRLIRYVGIVKTRASLEILPLEE